MLIDEEINRIVKEAIDTTKITDEFVTDTNTNTKTKTTASINDVVYDTIDNYYVDSDNDDTDDEFGNINDDNNFIIPNAAAADDDGDVAGYLARRNAKDILHHRDEKLRYHLSSFIDIYKYHNDHYQYMTITTF